MSHSRQDQLQSSSMSQNHAEDERRELRMWMRRRQRERLAAYQKHRETLREREHKPFSSSAAVVRFSRLFIRVSITCCVFEISHSLCYFFVLFSIQQPKIERPVREAERRKKSMYFIYLIVVLKKCVCLCKTISLDLLGPCFLSSTTRGPMKLFLWSVTFLPLLHPH